MHEECLTGFTAYGATVYPAAIAWGATWDPDLVRRMAAMIGRDMAALGVHQGLSPVLDVVRDYRWGRVEETLGEDPFLVGSLGTAYVQGLQSAGVIATLKHFAGYSASRAARNHGPVSMGLRELRDVILPTFEMAVAIGGVGSVMNSYSDVDGVPAGANPWLLTEVLRDEWGFEGTVVSDYWAVPFLASMHRVAAGFAEAGALALEAGIDVELPDTLGYGDGLVELVRSGTLDETFVDRAARRALLAKAQLGLLDAGWTPEASVANAAGVDLDSPANRELAREVAERSVVLLDAGTALPIRSDQRPLPQKVAVVGPTSDDPLTFMGCYAFPNHVLPRHPRAGLGIEVPTALDALRAELGEVEIVHETGCAVMGEDRSGFPAAVAAARGADLCLAFVGDLAGLFGHGSSGEGCDAEDLRLPGVQAELVEELLATGTPVVLVVVSGRPYALGTVHERLAGLVQSFFPGEEGGSAIAGVLSGRLCPGGKLPVQLPRRAGGQPSTYLQPPLGGIESAGITTVDSTPLYPFGYGASYTSFELGEVRASAEEIGTDEAVELSVVVTNTGDRSGDEVVQVYLHDPVARVARPVQAADRLRAGPPRARGLGGGRLRRPRRPHCLHRPGDGPDRRDWRGAAHRRHLGRRRRSPDPRPAHRCHPHRRSRPSSGHARARRAATEPLATRHEEDPRCRRRSPAPRWPRWPRRRASRSPRSPRCSTVGATSRRRRAPGCRRCSAPMTTAVG